ncbi:putative disease resistance protein RGA1 [Triticum aestivum]|uniref:putative disease resistance protein RGA1 n=1 Tax=Triticum aestivum TaxID=4565 RepID=UPI001D020F52|nr:putative disease resistance protein RGA1 [Triticum aestivum]
MTCLRHLYTHRCHKLKSMPPGLGNLTNLRMLTCFVVGVPGPDCSDVAELQNLNLGGQLELRRMENVIEAKAKVANIGNKKDLRELTLRWTSVCDSKVLDNFEPRDGLQVLKIYFYGGEYMGMLQNMVEIHLVHCERLHFLFRCGTSFTFPKLKVLTLEHLLNFETWWEINERQEERIIFPLLEKLFIRHCGKLIALPEAPQLFIGKCGKLIALPEALLIEEASSRDYRLVRSPFPALKVLELENLQSFLRWDAVEGTHVEHMFFPLLEKLSVQKCPKVIDLSEAPKLSVLEIEDGKQEMLCWVDKYLSSLTNLILKLEDIERRSEAQCTLSVPVDSNEKWNQKSPLTVMELGCCNSFFGAGALEPWDYFVHLKN